MRDLLSAVRAELLPIVEPLGLKVVDSQVSETFDNATVTVAAGDVRVRVFRERSVVHAEFASAAKPHAWFDSAVVVELLGLGREGGFHSPDAEPVLVGLGQFLNAFWGELALRFNGDRFPQTERELISVREAQDRARWG